METIQTCMTDDNYLLLLIVGGIAANNKRSSHFLPVGSQSCEMSQIWQGLDKKAALKKEGV